MMELDKIKNLSAAELKHEEKQASEQLFRLRFQAKLGQTEGVKKIRGLRKDIARIKTLARQHELGIAVAPAAKSGKTTSAKAAKKTKKGSR